MSVLHKKKYRLRLFLLSVILVFSAVVFSSVKLYIKLSPLIDSYILSSVRSAFSREISAAVKAETEKADYSQLIDVSYDNNGCVSSFKADMQKVNLLKENILSALCNNLTNISPMEIKLPLNYLFFGINEKLSPVIRLNILPSADIYGHTENALDETGINQSRHRLTLSITADITVFLKGKILTDSLTKDILLSETIIFGTVPDNYSK